MNLCERWKVKVISYLCLKGICSHRTIRFKYFPLNVSQHIVHITGCQEVMVSTFNNSLTKILSLELKQLNLIRHTQVCTFILG